MLINNYNSSANENKIWHLTFMFKYHKRYKNVKDVIPQNLGTNQKDVKLLDKK